MSIFCLILRITLERTGLQSDTRTMRPLSRRTQSVKLLAFLTLSICFLLFQNMSPLSDTVELDLQSVEKPKDFDQVQYLPQEFHSSSLEGLSQEILDHNFGDQLRQMQFEIEMKLGSWTNHSSRYSRAPSSIQNLENLAADEQSPGRLRLRLAGKDKVELSYLSPIEFRLDYSAISKKIDMSLETRLTLQTKLSLKHTTEDQMSSLQFRYQW